MRVVALGGSGAMGRFAVRSAEAFDFVDSLVVADRDEAAASAFASECGAKVVARALDVQDEGELRGLLAGADVVLNTVGPFFRFGVPILRGCIESGCHYLDINDDWEPTLEMLALDAEARAAGITAVVGLGASPGVSNMLAAAAARELDRVEELYTGWGTGGGGGQRRARGTTPRPEPAPRRPSAALVHWLHQCSGTIRVLRGGGLVEVPPIEEIELDFPGIGAGIGWSVGHPEAVTLPRTYTDLRECVNVMVGPPALMDRLRVLGDEIDAGRLTPEAAAALPMFPLPPELEARVPHAPESAEGARLPGLFALAVGEKGGKRASAGATVGGIPAGGMGGATGVPLAIGLALLHGGRIEGRGVFAPEAVIDPDAFFDALAPRCAPPLERGSDVLRVGTSS